jgi:two-component system LytT family response regulator
MNNYKALIIDDEPKLRKVLEFKLAKYCPDIQLVGTAGNAEEAFTEIKNLKPDIIFLDISMPGESGFDLLNRFDSIDFEIIFVTGFNDYVLDALKVSAVDYLLKPVVTANLVAAVEKAKSRIEDRQKVKMYHVLLII